MRVKKKILGSHGWKCISCISTILIMTWSTGFTQQRLFEVLPPEKVLFNWPEPPKIEQPNFFKIAQQGKALCVIQYPADQEVQKNLALKLSQYLELVTGPKYQIVADSAAIPEGMAVIHLGETLAAKKTGMNLPDVRYGKDVYPNLNGYLVQTINSRTLVIRGLTDNAVAAGVVGFLRRFVGVDQYWLGAPGKLGEYTPKNPTLSIPKVEWRDWPYYYSRTMSQATMFEPVSKSQILGFTNSNALLPSGENYARWLVPAKYSKEHPEYYSLVNGKRQAPPPESTHSSGWQPCVSNPEVVRVMAEGVIAFFEANPNLPGINFSINDGGRDCMCEGCLAMDTPNSGYAGMADRYVKFTNAACKIIEKKFPNKRIIMLAYAAVSSPPLTEKLHRMILPVLSSAGRNIYSAWDSWVKVGASEMGLYIHHDDFLYFVLPKADPHHMARRIRYAMGSGRVRSFYMEAHTLWPTTGCVPYVTARLLWDPRLNVDALMDDYCRGLFGPAAGPMKRFYSTLESGVDRWTEEKGKPHWFGKESSPISNGRSVEQYFVLNTEEAARAAQALAEAQNIKQSDPRFSKHIEAVAICFRLQHLAVNEYWAANRLRNASPKSEADAVRIIEDSRALFKLRLEAADMVKKVMKAPPANKYNLFERVGGRAMNVSYGKMASRDPLPEYMASISSGMDSAADYLRGKLGSDKAGDWWVKAYTDEKEPILVKAMQGAESRARGIILQNLIKEPGYEAAGKKIELSELTPGRAIELNKKQYGSLGIRLWNPERSPFKILLQQNDVHSGENALTMQNCSRARVDTFVRAESRSRYRISFWAKCNDTSGSYSYEVFTRAKKSNKNLKISNGTITRQVNEWQNIVTDVETPADCQLLILFIYVRGQKQNTTLILDDIFIAKYPQK